MYHIVTRVTSDVSVPSAYLVELALIHFRKDSIHIQIFSPKKLNSEMLPATLCSLFHLETEVYIKKISSCITTASGVRAAHWGRDMMPAFCGWYFQQCKLLYFNSTFIEICFHGSNWQSSSNGSDNGLVPNRQQAIIWISAGILLIRSLGANVREIWFKIPQILRISNFKKMHVKMSSILPQVQCDQFSGNWKYT